MGDIWYLICFVVDVSHNSFYLWYLQVIDLVLINAIYKLENN